MAVELGQNVVDTVTGYRGVVTCVAEYLGASDRRIQVTAPLDHDGKPVDPQWLDEQRLTEVAPDDF